MKKRILKAFAFSLAFLPTLSSCFYLENGRKETKISTIDPSHSSDAVYKEPNYPAGYKKENLTNANIGLGSFYRYLPTTGNSKILVVPVETSNESFTSKELDLIEKGFFGSSKETGWESVASFYEKSSYGALHISGEVAPTVKLNMTTSELEAIAKSYDKQGKTYTDTLLANVIKLLDDKKAVNLADYDTNSDGYVDGVWLVYSATYNSSSDFYWAYTTWAMDNTTYSGKKLSCYAWASVDFLTEMDYSSLLDHTNIADAHTFIHETGHMLGLDDYYSYDYDYSPKTHSGNTDTPIGGVDMMDFNIGDHNSFSKYLLGWKKPTVITDEYLSANNNTLTLRSQTETGDSFLIPVDSSYNGTALDEYLLVEYYTPTGLNEMDAKKPYGDSGLGTYTKNGVLVYHINATVGKIVPDSKGNPHWDGYAYDMLPSYSSDWGKYYLFAFLYSNTRSYSWDSNISDTGLSFYRGRLISLLPSSGNRVEGLKTGFADNNVLFGAGSSFENSYSDFKFDDGNKCKYSFTVNSTNSSSCSLEFKEAK